MAYRGVLLDFYGTLVSEDDEIVSEICNQIFENSGLARQKAEIETWWWESFCRLTGAAHGDSFIPQRQIALQSLSETMHHFGVLLDPELLIESQFAQWQEPKLFSETKAFLDWISKAKIPVCVISNIDRSDIEAALRFNGISLQHIITSDDVRAYKPRPELFLAGLKKLNMEPDEVLHIGDSRGSDVVGALASGLSVAWLNRTSKSPDSGHKPTHTIQNLREVIPLFN